MGNHCFYTVCRECGEEYCLRCEMGICPKCGTPWNAKPRMMTVYDYIGEPNDENMNIDEIYNTAVLLGKTDKIRLVNRLLASLNNGKKEMAETEPTMPVYEGLHVFSEIYLQKKGVAYTIGKYSGADYKSMRDLLVKISDRLSEGGTATVTDALRIGNLKMFLEAVSVMKNRWYFENRFTPYGLNHDFENIYTNLKNKNDHARQQTAFSYL